VKSEFVRLSCFYMAVDYTMKWRETKDMKILANSSLCLAEKKNKPFWFIKCTWKIKIKYLTSNIVIIFKAIGMNNWVWIS